jgi:hypothetical protein
MKRPKKADQDVTDQIDQQIIDLMGPLSTKAPARMSAATAEPIIIDQKANLAVNNKDSAAKSNKGLKGLWERWLHK